MNLSIPGEYTQTAAVTGGRSSGEHPPGRRDQEPDDERDAERQQRADRGPLRASVSR